MQGETARTQSLRYAWNVRHSRPLHGDRVYEARLSSLGRVVMRKRYALETAAALAADVAKVVLHGESAESRLNFPGDRNLQLIPVDFREARRTLETDLISQAWTSAEAEVEAVRLIRSTARDVTNSLTEYIGTGSLSATSRRDCLERLDALAKIAQNLELENSTTRDAGSVSGVRVDGGVTGVVDDDSLRSGAVFVDRQYGDYEPEDPKVDAEKPESSPQAVSLVKSSSDEADAVSPGDAYSVFGNGETTDGRAVRIRETAATLDSPQFESSILVAMRSVTSASPPCDAMSHTEVELLLSLSDTAPNLFTVQLGCTCRNLQYIYLTQQSVLRTIELENALASRGWDISLQGVHLLEGVLILISHTDNWRIRRVNSWDRMTGVLILEDGSSISPLQISNRGLDESQSYARFVDQELNYRIECSGFQPLALTDLASVHHRLSCCKEAIDRLQIGHGMEPTLRLLISKLVHRPSVQYLRELRACTDPMSVTGRRRQAQHYTDTVCMAGQNLRDLFRCWLGIEQPMDVTQSFEDAMLHWMRARAGDQIPRPPDHAFCTVAARDPRTQTRKRPRTKHTNGAQDLSAAPRRSVSGNRTENSRSRDRPVSRGRLRPVLEVPSAGDELAGRLGTDFTSFLDIERAARIVGRDLHHTDRYN